MSATTHVPSRERLRHAFDVFSRASAKLTASYEDLRGRVEHLSGALADANDSLARELAHKKALAARQGALLGAMPAGIVVVGSLDTIIEANPAACQLLGGTLGGKRWSEVRSRALHPTAVPSEWMTCGVNARRIALAEQRLGNELERVIVLSDVTETYAAHERCERAQRLGGDGEMAARLAHQLRTPLSAALLYVTHLGAPDLTPEDRVRYADCALARLRQLERVTRDMLRFVRGGGGRHGSVGAGKLVAEAAQSVAPLMARRGVVFTLDDRSDGAVLLGERDSLAAALVSLLENALQSTPPGGKVRLAVFAGAQSIRISVSDSGTGFDSDTMERLFEPFFSTRPSGTGLGLAIVRSVVEAHGGTVDASSAPGAGAEFVITLPRCSETSISAMERNAA